VGDTVVVVIEPSRSIPGGGPVSALPLPPVRAAPVLGVTRFIRPQFRIRAEGTGITVQVSAAVEPPRT